MKEVRFSEAFLFWLKLGFISFGGPAGQIAMMHEELVTRRKWIDEQRFSDGLGFCTLLPGPEAQQLAIYIGWRLHGIRGGIVAGTLFILPSMLLLLGLSIAYVVYGQHPAAEGILYFLRPAVLAIIVAAFSRMAAKSLRANQHFMAAFAAFMLMTFFNVDFPYIIVGALLLGGILPGKPDPAPVTLMVAEPENTRFRNPMILGSGILLWLLPMAFVVLFRQDFGFWSNLSLFFTRAACITFGGAYAVLPYVADTAVNHAHWLTREQMVDGLALGETTPGPLIMVLAFVGFMAAYGQSGGSILLGTAGLLMTVWYTFLPGFIFVLLGAPVVERISASGLMRKILMMVSAAVTGVILHLAYNFGTVVLHNPFGEIDWMAFLIAVIAFALLQQKKLSIPWMILVSVAAGIAWSVIRTRL